MKKLFLILVLLVFVGVPVVSAQDGDGEVDSIDWLNFSIESELRNVFDCDEAVNEALPILALDMSELAGLAGTTENFSKLAIDYQFVANQNMYNGLAMRACLIGLDWETLYEEQILEGMLYEFNFKFDQMLPFDGIDVDQFIENQLIPGDESD